MLLNYQFSSYEGIEIKIVNIVDNPSLAFALCGGESSQADSVRYFV